MSTREAMKAAYKLERHRMRAMGVFQIKNHVNGKVFLDASPNLEGTISRDRSWLARGFHMNADLLKDWKAFGAEAFTFDVLDVLEPTDEPRNYRDELTILLDIWKETLQPYGDRGYMKPPRA